MTGHFLGAFTRYPTIRLTTRNYISALSKSTYSTNTISSQTQPTTASIWFQADQSAFLTLKLKEKVTFQIKRDKPISFLLSEIHEEEPTIKEAALYEMNENGKGYRIARSTSSDEVLQIALKNGGLNLKLDEKDIFLEAPTLETRLQPFTERLALAEAEFQALANAKKKLDDQAHNAAVRFTWIGMFALCAQWGMMVRLTYWEYSWDVIEPISYFLTAGTGILGYVFYCLTLKEYTYETLHGVAYSRRRLKLYEAQKFDLLKYYEMKEKVDGLKEQIRVIKNQY